MGRVHKANLFSVSKESENKVDLFFLHKVELKYREFKFKQLWHYLFGLVFVSALIPWDCVYHWPHVRIQIFENDVVLQVAVLLKVILIVDYFK